MIRLEQTANWPYLLVGGRTTELTSLRFTVKFVNEEDTPWFVGDQSQPTRGFNTSPFQMLVPAGLRLALPRRMIEGIPEFRPCEITLEETAETSTLIMSGIRVPEQDEGWLNDLGAASEPPPAPPPPPPPPPPPLPPPPLPPPPPPPPLPPPPPPPDSSTVQDQPAEVSEPPVLDLPGVGAPGTPPPSQPALPSTPPHKCPPATRPILFLLILGWLLAAASAVFAFYIYKNAWEFVELTPDAGQARRRVAELERQLNDVRTPLAAFSDPEFRNVVIGAERSPRGKILDDESLRCRGEAQRQRQRAGAGPQDDVRNLDPFIWGCLKALAPAAGTTGGADLQERRFWLAAALRAGDAQAANQLAVSFLAPAFNDGGSAGVAMTITGGVRDRVFAFKFLELQVAVALVADRGRNLVAAREPVNRLVALTNAGAFPWTAPAR